MKPNKVLRDFKVRCNENNRKVIFKQIGTKKLVLIENDEGKFETYIYLEGLGGKILSYNKSIWVSKFEKIYIEKKNCKILFNFYGDWLATTVKQFIESRKDGKKELEGYQAVIDFDTSFKFQRKNNEEENFVHLHNHFEYSQLDGTLRAKQWLEYCADNNIKAISLTDHGTLSGIMDFYLEAKKKNIKPILGIETYIVEGLSNERSATRHLTLLARNNIGWRNLLKLNTFAQLEGFYYKPRITYKKLLEYGKGLIILTGCPASKFIEYLRNSNIIAAIKLYKFYCQCSGEENVYIEYQYHNFKRKESLLEQDLIHRNMVKVIKQLKKLKMNPKVVVTNDCHYILPEDFDVWDSISKINIIKDDEDRKDILDDLYLKSRKQLFTEFQQTKIYKKNLVTIEQFAQWCNNSVRIAKRCNVEIPVGQHNLPEFPFDKNKYKTKEELFDGIIKKGFDIKIVRQWNPQIKHSKKHTLKNYHERLQKEIEVIKKAGFVDYFLIIWDIIKSAKQNGIFVGAARGSVAGSLVAYVMDITDVDPIKFDLLFERFLNETRVSGERAKEADSLPDIDMDFESYGRDWVKHYVEKRYGKRNVCSLATFGRLQLRAAIKDIGKNYGGLSFEYLNQITRNIFGSEKEDLVEALVKNKEVEEFLDENQDIMKIVYRCMGQVRHSSVHPAGMIISPKYRVNNKGKKVLAHLDDFIPIKNMTSKENKEEKVLVSEWEGNFVERRGLLKIDVLGIRQLDIFKDILKLIEIKYNEKIDLNNIDLEDSKVYEKFCQGDTEGVFQFKSRTQKDYQKKLQPSEFEHLIAANALLRPGAMSSDAHNDFVAMKNGDKEAEFDRGLEKVTEKTQGLYIYQEQIMQAMVVGGGLSLSEADVVRTAIKKFDREKMEKYKDKFLNGIKRIHKYNDKEAKKVWDKLVAFSGYGFNRSHSCSYAMIGYQCQWLKVYYPSEFWVVNLEYAGEDDRLEYVNRILNSYSNIEFVYPDINESKVGFDIKYEKNKEKIIWGLRHIKGVGDKASVAIIEARSNKEFVSLKDFLDRVEKRVVNKRVVEALIYAGAFDELYDIEKDKQDGKRFTILVDYYKLRKEKKELQFEGDLFYKSEYKRLVGVNIVDWDKVLEHNGLKDDNDYTTLYEDWQLKDEKSYCLIAGVVLKVIERTTKKGDLFGIVELQQQGVSVDILIWSDHWIDEKFKDKIKIGSYIAIRGIKMKDTFKNSYILQTKSGVTELWKLKTKKIL